MFIKERLMKKFFGFLVLSVLILLSFVGCSDDSNKSESKATTGDITVISREDGSGTRGAFIELVGIRKKNSEGKKIDRTADSAEIVNSTSIVMTSVEGNENAIGYISLGSLNDKVKALKVDGNDANIENIKSGAYKVARPFNIATKGNHTPEVQDFLDFIHSEIGQKIAEDRGYISVGDMPKYESKKLSGKITVSGSTSVGPLMEAVSEEYKKLNPDMVIEIQQTGSSAGMTDAIDGVSDIGMASRELKQGELDAGLKPIVMAMDGIAIIVNNNNSFETLTSEQVMKIFIGEITKWEDIK